MEWVIGITVLLMIVGAIQAATVTNPGRALNKKFVSLGALSGKTRDEISAVAGAPSSISAIGNGQTLLQWQATGYHIALVFDGEVCAGVSHEYAHQR